MLNAGDWTEADIRLTGVVAHSITDSIVPKIPRLTMTSILLPAHLRAKLGAEMKMDVHWVDVKLANGTKVMNLVVRGGTTITGRAADPNGEGALPFVSDDIVALRRHALLGVLWPFWGLDSSGVG